MPVRERPQRIFSWKSFFLDQSVTIVAALGAFLILIGALSFIVTNTARNPSLTFLIVFGVQALFGCVGYITYPFPNLRFVSRLYTSISALLVPLVGYAGYSLIHIVPLPAATLIAIAAGYAAIVYAVLAVSQRFTLFGYLGAAALVVVDLAIARQLGLDYWWWPSMLMLLALPALISVSSSASSNHWPFLGMWAVLRTPVRALSFMLVGACATGAVVTTLYSFLLDTFGSSSWGSIRFSILSMTLLLLLWMGLYLWRTKHTQWMLLLACLFLASVLAFCYALNFQEIGYALALTGTAVLYHGLSRFTPRLLQPFGKLGLRLDQLALLVVAIVPLVISPQLPSLLFARAYSYEPASTLSFTATWGTVLAVSIGLALTLSVTLSRAGVREVSTMQQNAWPWLLVLSGVLFTWEFAAVVLTLPVAPVWCFLGLAVLMVAGAVIVRRRFGVAWANPLDLLALGAAILTIILQPYTDHIWALPLFFAILFYGVLLYQRRRNWLFVPFVFALVVLVFGVLRPQVILLMAVLLPFIAVAVRRLMPVLVATPGSAGSTERSWTIGWEWPPLTIALLSGILISLVDLYSPTGIENFWLGVPFPAALEIASFALVWYIAAALTRVKWRLVPVISFAVGALLVPFTPFWVLVGVTFVSAALALGVGRFAGRVWTSPLYVVTVLAAVMTGIAGHTQDHLLPITTLILLAFALLFYIMGAIEDWTPWLWMMPMFAIWSLIGSMLLQDFYRLPTIVLASAAVGVAVSSLRRFIPAFRLGLRYALPCYATASAAALLTGLYGTLPGFNEPFAGAVAAALLLYAVIAYGVLLFGRIPEALVFPVGLAIWAIGLTHWEFWQLMVAYSLLCVLIIASQFIWKIIPPAMNWLPATLLHQGLALCGQALVVLAIIVQGGLSTDLAPLVHVGPWGLTLAHIGAGALAVLALLLFWCGRLQDVQPLRRCCYYVAGLLLSLVISWALSACGQTYVEWLWLGPTSYLAVIAPLLMRDETIPYHQRLGQMCTIVDAACLLLPTLWLSFGDSNLLPTLILAGKALALLLLGLGTRLRTFILSGAGMVVVAALHALFLPALGVPPSLALTALGLVLLALATGLSLTRRRLQVAWTSWE